MKGSHPLIVSIALIVISTYGLAAAGKRQILVFGGNGFLGSSSVERFLHSGDDVTLVSRGTWYFDSQTRILPRVKKHFKCNRRKPITGCEDLVEFIKETREFDAVLDFSGYEKFEINECANILQGKVKVYIYISTVSVYDVCNITHTGPSIESDADSPLLNQVQTELDKTRFIYGMNKLKAEKEIIRQRKRGGFPYVILRLPDTLGPRDTSSRWWTAQLALGVASKINNLKLNIPSSVANHMTSFVYSEDVSEVIHRIPSMDSQIYDQAFNLAYEETFTLKQFLMYLASEQGLNGEDLIVEVEDTGISDRLIFFPCVFRGPTDSSKARSMLNFTSTPWSTMMADTVQFYKTSAEERAFPKEYDTARKNVAFKIFNNVQDKWEIFELMNIPGQRAHNTEL